MTRLCENAGAGGGMMWKESWEDEQCNNSHSIVRGTSGLKLGSEPGADAQRDVGGVDNTELLLTELKYLGLVKLTRNGDAEFPISHVDTPLGNHGNKSKKDSGNNSSETPNSTGQQDKR